MFIPIKVIELFNQLGAGTAEWSKHSKNSDDIKHEGIGSVVGVHARLQALLYGLRLRSRTDYFRKNFVSARDQQRSAN